MITKTFRILWWSALLMQCCMLWTQQSVVIRDFRLSLFKSRYPERVINHQYLKHPHNCLKSVLKSRPFFCGQVHRPNRYDFFSTWPAVAQVLQHLLSSSVSPSPDAIHTPLGSKEQTSLCDFPTKNNIITIGSEDKQVSTGNDTPTTNSNVHVKSTFSDNSKISYILEYGAGAVVWI